MSNNQIVIDEEEKMDFQLVITKMDNSSVKELIQLLSPEEINVTKSPELGLLMMISNDSFGTDFCLGEILVTEAVVEYKGLKGYAMVMGDEPERAVLAASVNAVLQADIDAMKDLRRKVIDFITVKAKKITKEEEIEKRLIAQTRVNFEIMAKR